MFLSENGWEGRTEVVVRDDAEWSSRGSDWDLRQEGRHESKSRGLGWGSPLPEAQDAGRGVTEVESRVLTPGEARQQVRVSKGP